MKTSHQDFGHVTVVTLSGEFTADDAERFTRDMGDRIAAGVRDLVFDCENLEFIDSAGLEAMLRLRDRAAERMGQVRLVRPDPNVAKILEITRLVRVFQSHENLEAAVRSLR